MSQEQNNFQLTGDEARLLMIALASSGAAVAPSAAVLSLYRRLETISTVQPPVEQKEDE